jgi:hypothetical protein
MSTLLYKYMPAKFGMESIRNNNIKLTTIQEANDLYEFKVLTFQGKEGGIIDLYDPDNWFKNELILCLSKSYYSPVMWAHYAQNNSGFVLGYECTTQNINLINVRYDSNMSGINQLNQSIHSKFEEKLAEIKYKDWAYEEEVRILFPKEKANAISINDRMHYFLELLDGGPLKLREIIFGIKCDNDQYYDEILKIVDNNVNIYKAEQSKTMFKIEKISLV